MKHAPRNRLLWYLFLVELSFVSSAYGNDYAPNQSIFCGKRSSDWKTKTLILSNSYCKTTDSPKEAEELLDYESKHIRPRGSWWKRYNIFGDNVREPKCAIFPNALFPKRTPTAQMPISLAKFFDSRGIHIPIKPGRKRHYSIVFNYLKRDPVSRRMLECDCSVLSDEVTNRHICDYGGVVHLSRGVGGDRSFFVHTPTGTDYNVIAHICFPSNV